MPLLWLPLTLPQCTKSLGPNQPQNLKLRLCIWQQGSLFLILSYPGLFKNIPHVWFLRLYSFLKNLQHDFPKMRGGGGQRPFGTFPKIHPFWYGEASLTLLHVHTPLHVGTWNGARYLQCTYSVLTLLHIVHTKLHVLTSLQLGSTYNGAVYLQCTYTVASTYTVACTYTAESTYTVARTYAVTCTYTVANIYTVASTYIVTSTYIVASTYTVTSNYTLASHTRYQEKWIFPSYKAKLNLTLFSFENLITDT